MGRNTISDCSKRVKFVGWVEYTASWILDIWELSVCKMQAPHQGNVQQKSLSQERRGEKIDVSL